MLRYGFGQAAGGGTKKICGRVGAAIGDAFARVYDIGAGQSARSATTFGVELEEVGAGLWVAVGSALRLGDDVQRVLGRVLGRTWNCAGEDGDRDRHEVQFEAHVSGA